MTHIDDDADETMLAAIEAHQRGDLASAETKYRMAAGLGVSDAAFQLGVILEDQRRFEEAADSYRIAVRDGDREASLNLANLLVDELHSFDEAESIYRKAVEAGDERAAFDYGTALARVGRNREAEELFLQAIKMGEARGHRGIGWLRLAGGDVESARAAYDRAVSAGDGEGAASLGEALREHGGR